MWPKLLMQLFELLPHISRLVPMADKYFSQKAAAEKALVVLGPRGRLIDASALVDAYLGNASRRLSFFARYGFELESQLIAVR